MSKKDSLGKGLGAIFSDLIDETPDKPNFIMCGIEELTPNKFQPRKFFDGEEQKNLVASIKKNGIIQPIIVRNLDSGYEIIAGERRWRAAQTAQLKTVPVIIKEADDIEVAELSLIENIQREDLNPVEEAQAYQSLMNTFHLSQEDISGRTGKDRSTIANSVRLLKLPAEIQDALVQKTISAGHARALLSLNSMEGQISALKDIVKKQLNVRQTETAVKMIKRAPSEPVKTKKSTVIIDVETQLSKTMMTSVKINQRSKGGTIQIRYRDSEDLDRLIRHMLDV
jgi:ParB family transcriptional regulator, chromosome partitioning protein